jgi:hypothetical protein
MNLFLYWEYTEWIFTYTENTRNEVNLRIFAMRNRWLREWTCLYTGEYAEWICPYTKNMQNEFLRILRIRRMHETANWNQNQPKWVSLAKPLEVKSLIQVNL